MPLVSHPSLRRPVLLALVAVLLTGLVATRPAPAAAAPVTDATPWVVSVGDSYISGEGGRWAGNQTGPTTGVDALGETAYFDNADGTAELIERCHRSRSAPVHIGDGVNSLNLACAGSTTSTVFSNDKGRFKPGIDFAQDGSRKGQAQMLKEFAAEHPVRMVVLSVGGNDFNFEGIVKQCVKDYLKPALFGIFKSLCSRDDDATANVSTANAGVVQDRIAGAIKNVQTAMHEAGVPDGSWTLVVNTYPRILPYGADFRYWEVGGVRQALGGCGLYDADVAWALNEVLGTVNRSVLGAVDTARAARPQHRITVLDTTKAFDQRGLCDEHVGRVGSAATPGFFSDVNHWTDRDAVDNSEWVSEINILNTWDYFTQESLHPNYWGQLALRNCLRQVWNGGAPAGGTCTRGTGLNADGEPNMSLMGARTSPVPVANANHFLVVNRQLVVDRLRGVLSDDIDHPDHLAASPAAVAAASAPADAGEARVLGTVEVAAPEGGLSATLVEGPAHGTLRLLADGSFVYEAPPGFTGIDHFTYAASDFYGRSAPATVTLEVVADTAASTAPASPVVMAPAFTG